MPFSVIPELYHIWQSMRNRCLNPKAKSFKDYGGRGIKICTEWNSYSQFKSDMSPRPVGTSIERIDNDGDYTPQNCRWATRKEQQRNQRITRKVVVRGKTYLAVELAERSGMKTDTIVKRAEANLTLKQILDNKRRVFTPGLALRGKASGDRRRARTHCKPGHEFTRENTYFTPQGWRNCRKCHADKMRRQQAAFRAIN